MTRVNSNAIRLVCFSATMLMGAAVFAQDNGDSGVVYKKKTVVSFSDETIDGDLTRPDGAYVETRKRVRHSSLIRIRDNFRERILRSVMKL